MIKLSEKIETVIQVVPSFYKMLNLGQFTIKSNMVDIFIHEYHNGTRTVLKLLDGSTYTSIVYNDKHYKEELKVIRNKLFEDISKYIKEHKKSV